MFFASECISHALRFLWGPLEAHHIYLSGLDMYLLHGCLTLMQLFALVAEISISWKPWAIVYFKLFLQSLDQ